MQNKLRQLVVSALKRNEFTANLPLQVGVRGYHVIISGNIDSDELICEVVATAESVSPYLVVHNLMKVQNRRPAGVG